jgi:mitochondrial fission protein ELM1
VESLSEHLDFSALRAWVLSDGKAGHLNQSLGVADAMGLTPQIVILEARRFGNAFGFIDPRLAVKNLPPPPYPDVVIGTGALTALVARHIKMTNPRTFTVQLMSPRRDYWAYDVVAAPLHDSLPARPNIIRTLGAPNRLTPARLAEAAERWRPAFAHLPPRCLAVLVGGTSRRYAFTPQKAAALAEAVADLAKRQNMGLLITVSRRTGPEAAAVLKEKLGGPATFFWDGTGDNPYMGFLALADAMVVTADSVSMVSDACSVGGKPVYVFDMAAPELGKFVNLFEALKQQDRVRPLGAAWFNANPQPLADAQRVAGHARALYLRTRLASA